MSRKCAGCKKWLAAGQYTCPFCKRGEADLRSDLESSGLFFFCLLYFVFDFVAEHGKLRSIFSSGVSFESEASLVLPLLPCARRAASPFFVWRVAAGPVWLLLACGETCGCNVVDKVHLGALVAKLKGQRAVASEKAEALATRERKI